MAWDDSGGGRDKDPWGTRGDQGPPDLDEALRKLQGQLSGIFGRGRGGGAKRGGGINLSVFGIAIAVLVLGYGFWGLYQVDQQERGVVFRFGEVRDEVVLPGLHWNPPIIDRVERVNVTRVNDHEHQALMLTEDENIVDIGMTVQYVIDNPVDYLVKVKNPLVSIDHATESAPRSVRKCRIVCRATSTATRRASWCRP